MCRRGGAGLATAFWLLWATLGCSGQLEDAQRHYCGGPCQKSRALASLAMSLRGSGAHRELVYRLEITCSPLKRSEDTGASSDAASATAAPPPAVRAALLQPLPPAVFTDIYQLDNAVALGQGPAVQLFGTVDVESIERYSHPTVLAVLCDSNASSAASQASVARMPCQQRSQPAAQARVFERCCLLRLPCARYGPEEQAPSLPACHQGTASAANPLPRSALLPRHSAVDAGPAQLHSWRRACGTAARSVSSPPAGAAAAAGGQLVAGSAGGASRH